MLFYFSNVEPVLRNWKKSIVKIFLDVLTDNLWRIIASVFLRDFGLFFFLFTFQILVSGLLCCSYKKIFGKSLPSPFSKTELGGLLLFLLILSDRIHL